MRHVDSRVKRTIVQEGPRTVRKCNIKGIRLGVMEVSIMTPRGRPWEVEGAVTEAGTWASPPPAEETMLLAY
jgi:hypothetical protein